MGTNEPGPGMDETTDDTGSGLTRREAIKKGAIVGGTALWAAPLVQSVGMSSAGAQTPSPGGGACTCVGSNSFDVRVTTTGVVNVTVGPLQSFPEENGCLANAKVGATTTGAVDTDALLTAALDCVGGTGNGATCSSFVELTNLHTDLTAVFPELDVQLDASVVRAEAECTCGGGCTASSCITQADGAAIVTIGGVVALAGTGTVQLCERREIAINLVVGTTTVTGTIVLNDTSTNPCQATVARVNATLTNVLGATQAVEVVIGRATAVCTPT